jgi:hypothetical protein
MTMLIGLMTGGRSWFLLEDTTDFKMFWTSNSPTPQIRVRITQVVETEGCLFLWKWIVTPSSATCIMLCATVLITSHRFSILPSHPPLPSPFTAPWLTPLFVPPAALVAPLTYTDDSGHDSGTESSMMEASSSPTRGAAKMAEGEILELTDFFKKTIMTEDDRQAYHSRGWLIGNLVSFIPEVDVPTVEGSTIPYFKSQLAAGLVPPPSKFLSSIMNYLECSLVHLNTNDVSALSSFVMLCECWLWIPPDTKAGE